MNLLVSTPDASVQAPSGRLTNQQDVHENVADDCIVHALVGP